MGDRWMTLRLAAERTGFGVPFFTAHTNDGRWAEGVVWKWGLGRKVIDLQALYRWIDKQASAPTACGRRQAQDEE